MKKTCYDCRALDWSGTGGTMMCHLGFKQKRVSTRGPITETPTPMEECPKPRTYEAFELYAARKNEGE